MAVAQGTASPVVQMVSLDTDSLVGCDDACTEAALQVQQAPKTTCAVPRSWVSDFLVSWRNGSVFTPVLEWF